jgi:hypothetical protein
MGLLGPGSAVAAGMAGRRSAALRWIRRAFLVWAAASSLWLANSYRTQGVDSRDLREDARVALREDAATLAFRPAAPGAAAALLFFCGSGVAAQAYAPLLRPVAEAGFPVYIVKLPYRFAPLESHKVEALARAASAMAAHPGIARWVVAGHSQGGALAARFAGGEGAGASALVLIGTTHPKARSLAALPIPVAKIYATNDAVAPPDRVLANKALLPPQTEWVEVAGGNHAQFGHYGRQLGDGAASITREAQQQQVRAVLLRVLQGVQAAARRPGAT